MSKLEAYGWTESLQAAFDAIGTKGALEPGRIIEAQRGSFTVWTARATLLAELAGRLVHVAETAVDLPGVGDWVALQYLPREDRGVIQRVLPRRGVLSRKTAGREAREQLLAANVDAAFVVTACAEDFNPRRLERYLTMIAAGGVEPVIVLNKADLADDVERFVRATEEVAPGVPVVQVSALRDAELTALAPWLAPGRTVVLIGSSGVGKSTLTNRLMKAGVQAVRRVRKGDAKGKHTTTARHMFLLPNGALLIDTPGMRELGLWNGNPGLGPAFDDVDALALECRFEDCRHEREPGCAVRGAVAPERLESWRKLQKELEHLARRESKERQAKAKKKWKDITKSVRQARKKGWMRD